MSPACSKYSIVTVIALDFFAPAILQTVFAFPGLKLVRKSISGFKEYGFSVQLCIPFFFLPFFVLFSLSNYLLKLPSFRARKYLNKTTYFLFWHFSVALSAQDFPASSIYHRQSSTPTRSNPLWKVFLGHSPNQINSTFFPKFLFLWFFDTRCAKDADLQLHEFSRFRFSSWPISNGKLFPSCFTIALTGHD